MRLSWIDTIIYQFILCILLISCKPKLPEGFVEQRILPQETDVKIKKIHGAHLLLYDSAVPSRHQLVLMITGTNAAPENSWSFDSTMASEGFDVIALDYPNTVITTVCSESRDSLCFNHFRQEINFGTPVSELVSVDSLNSIYNRLYSLLFLLKKQQHWSDYFKHDSIQWNNIIVAGHSQGAGHAAYLGKNFAVKSVIMLAGPQDYMNVYHQPAGWLYAPGATPPERYFALLHEKDPFNEKNQMSGCLVLSHHADTLVLPELKNIEGHPNILIIHSPASDPHGSVTQPSFAAAWKFMVSGHKN